MLDDWEEESGARRGQAGFSGTGFEDPSVEYDDPDGAPSATAKTPTAALAFDNPIFTTDALDRDVARNSGAAGHNHGAVTSVAAANGAVLVGTARGWLIRHDFNSGDAVEMDLPTSRGGEQVVHKVFVDPGGRHAIAAMLVTNGGAAEAVYTHARWKKARPLSRMKGTLLTAVAWNRQQGNDASTREIVLGSSKGQLYETVVEEKEKREKHLKLLYSLQDNQEPFTGLQMEVMASSSAPTRFFVMAVTPTRLFTFAGSGSLEATFAMSLERSPRFTELPGEMPNSELHFYGKKRAERFAWMAGPGIYHGQLNLGIQHSNEEKYVENKWLLEYAKLAGLHDGSLPLSMAVTDFHFILLYRHFYKVINKVSQQVVGEERFGTRLEVGPPGMLGLSHDIAGETLFAFSETTLYEIAAEDEGRDMWRLHLDRGEYAAALSHCRDWNQRDRVYAAQAEVAFAAGDFNRAATFYAKTVNTASFEEIALKFVAVGEQDALRTFLLHKLDHLGKEERSQITMVATWTVELYLDKINRLLLAAAPDGTPEEESSEYTQTVEEFRAFLSDCKDVLDEATTVKLLGSYGRVEELVHFATLKEQHATVIHHHIQRGDAKRAVMVLRKPNVSPELWYKFAAALMALDPKETVDAWMAAGAALDPRKLIPALVRYTATAALHYREGPNAAVQYLEFCVHRLQSRDSAIHNLLLSLYAKQEDEGALLRFLGGAKGGLNEEVFYDPKLALRLCLEQRRMRACVHIYSALGMHEEAVALALQVDLELAKAEADKAEEDEALRRKLWLRVARHVIEQERGEGGAEGENIRKAIAFLKETDGLLKIEDILPFFPDFALIDDFKEAICTSLEEYNRQIEELKAEMSDATRGADSIRRDIAALSQRYALVSREQECELCWKALLGPPPGGTKRRLNNQGGGKGGAAGAVTPFYVFPCEHAFHAECLRKHVLENTDEGERQRIAALRRKLAALVEQPASALKAPPVSSAMEEGDTSTAAAAVSPLDQVRSALDDAIAGECPFCGELMIRAVVQPFLSPEEEAEAKSWDIEVLPQQS